MKDLRKKAMKTKVFFLINYAIFFLYRDITDYTSGFLCIKRKVFENYALKGYYGEYFIDLVVYCRLNNYSIIELPFTERARYSGSSITYPGFTLKYLVTSINYLICFLKNFYKKLFL